MKIVVLLDALYANGVIIKLLNELGFKYIITANRNDWITNIEISKDNIYQLMKGGRARWRIDNETFNTLKNLGYNFEHNFGHGYKNLSVVLCYLMFIAFAIDQIQAYCGYHFKKLAAITYARIMLWHKIRACFEYVEFEDWEELYIYLFNKANKSKIDTS